MTVPAVQRGRQETSIFIVMREGMDSSYEEWLYTEWSGDLIVLMVAPITVNNVMKIKLSRILRQELENLSQNLGKASNNF